MMSFIYYIICFVYDLIYDILTGSPRFKCCSWPAEMQQDLNQMQALLAPYVCLSVCPGIKIGLQWFITL